MFFILLAAVLNFVYRRHCVIFVSRNGKTHELQEINIQKDNFILVDFGRSSVDFTPSARANGVYAL